MQLKLKLRLVLFAYAFASDFRAHLWNGCLSSLGAIYNAALQHRNGVRIEFVENRKLISRRA